MDEYEIYTCNSCAKGQHDNGYFDGNPSDPYYDPYTCECCYEENLGLKYANTVTSPWLLNKVDEEKIAALLKPTCKRK